MGKVVEKRKKKGRPSLLDLQKRSLKLQQQQQENQGNHRPHKRNSNPNLRLAPITNTPANRYARQNPNDDAEEAKEDAAEDDDDDSTGIRREKKLKFVLRLPSQRNSSSLNSGSQASDSNAEVENGATNHNKRKINAVGGRSACEIPETEEKLVYCTNSKSSQPGTQLDSGPSTPLPDKMLLIFILDRLQKKDSYGVFSEPVDLKELPDYHDIIKHPMDFGTVRQKLDSGAYANLEQFENDIFLISSNAMQYNSPDTIYFRQARSIKELAIKDFENLRQDSDNSEPEPKVVRRGRPPTKNLKKPLGRPPLEHAGTEFSSDSTPVTGGEGSVRSHYDPQKALLLEKNGHPCLSERLFHGSRKSEGCSNWLVEPKSDRHEEFTGTLSKGGLSSKLGKKQLVLDENRRNTYKQFHSSAGGKEPSVLSTFNEEKKQLMPVGLLSEFGYSRSLARFAATLGAVAWKIASKKIERSLPSGVKFGPGWVGESEPAPTRMPPFPPPPLSRDPFSDPTTSTVEFQADNSSEKTGMGDLLPPPASISGASEEAIVESTSHTVLNNSMDSSIGSVKLQNQQSPAVRPGINGFNGAQMRKLVEAMHSSGHVGLEAGSTVKISSVPPDLNVMFQSQQKSPSTGSMQPDLALQL